MQVSATAVKRPVVPPKRTGAESQDLPRPMAVIHAVDRERRVDVPMLEAGVAHFLRGAHQGGRAFEFGADSVDFTVVAMAQ